MALLTLSSIAAGPESEAIGYGDGGYGVGGYGGVVDEGETGEDEEPDGRSVHPHSSERPSA